MSTLLHDFRHALRALLKKPGFTLSAAAALALGIGLTTTIFSIVNGVILAELPFEEPDELLMLDSTQLEKGIRSRGLLIHEVEDFREQQSTLEGLAAFYTQPVNLSGDQQPEKVNGAFVSRNTFDLLGVQPIRGRGFLEEEQRPGAGRVILLGHHVWQTRFGGTPNIVGREIRVNGRPARVVGIMPEGFRFPARQDVWLPLDVYPSELQRGEGYHLSGFARLKDGASIEQARADLSAIAQRLARSYPEVAEGLGMIVKPYTHQFIGQEDRMIQFSVLGVVSLVLLIACSNVANLLIARTVGRGQELAVRSAMGAGRTEIMGQVLAESLVLSSFGAILGIGLTVGGVRLFNALVVDPDRPFWVDIDVDPTVLCFAVGAGIVASLVSGLAPALRASRADLHDLLRDESRGSSGLRLSRLSTVVVVAEIALSFSLLIAAGLVINQIMQIADRDYGFGTEGVLTAQLDLPANTYPEREDVTRFYDELMRRLDEAPGVVAAGAATHLPTAGSEVHRYEIEGHSYGEGRYPAVRTVVATPGFFESLEVPLLRGEGFPPDPEDQRRMVVVNKTFAEREWPGEEALGKQVKVYQVSTDEPWRTVVGVVPDLQFERIAAESPAAAYVPLSQAGRRHMVVTLRSRGQPGDLASVLRTEVQVIDKDLPVYGIKTMDQVLRDNMFLPNIVATVFSVFGLSALILAGVGIYGVMSYSVNQRTAEMGIRMAVGAQRRDVFVSVLRQVLRQCLWGVGVGLVLAFAMAQLVSSVFGAGTANPLPFAAALLVLLLIAFLSALMPARRATRIDPSVALRFE